MVKPNIQLYAKDASKIATEPMPETFNLRQVFHEILKASMGGMQYMIFAESLLTNPKYITRVLEKAGYDIYLFKNGFGESMISVEWFND